jgi:hypothetical protein
MHPLNNDEPTTQQPPTMTKSILMTGLLCFAVAMTSVAQKLPKFGADMGMKTAMGKEVRVPYTDLTSYYGYVAADATPDEERDGKKFYYLYIWVPVAAPELGIRMISPIPAGMEAAEGDFTGADYAANKAGVPNGKASGRMMIPANCPSSLPAASTTRRCG